MTELATSPYFAAVEPRQRDDPEPGTLLPEERVVIARELEQQIHEHPFRYYRAIEALGDLAIAHNASALCDLDLRAEDLGAAFRIYGYLSQQADQGVEFDAETEDALAHDSVYLEELSKFRSAKALTYSASSQRHFSRPNPNAPVVKNAIRRIRLAFYIRQVVASWGEQLSADILK